jgi:hypothetical protein
MHACYHTHPCNYVVWLPNLLAGCAQCGAGIFWFESLINAYSAIHSGVVMSVGYMCISARMLTHLGSAACSL